MRKLTYGFALAALMLLGAAAPALAMEARDGVPLVLVNETEPSFGDCLAAIDPMQASVFIVTSDRSACEPVLLAATGLCLEAVDPASPAIDLASMRGSLELNCISPGQPPPPDD